MGKVHIEFNLNYKSYINRGGLAARVIKCIGGINELSAVLMRVNTWGLKSIELDYVRNFNPRMTLATLHRCPKELIFHELHKCKTFNLFCAILESPYCPETIYIDPNMLHKFSIFSNIRYTEKIIFQTGCPFSISTEQFNRCKFSRENMHEWYEHVRRISSVFAQAFTRLQRVDLCSDNFYNFKDMFPIMIELCTGFAREMCGRQIEFVVHEFAARNTKIHLFKVSENGKITYRTSYNVFNIQSICQLIENGIYIEINPDKTICINMRPSMKESLGETITPEQLQEHFTGNIKKIGISHFTMGDRDSQIPSDEISKNLLTTCTSVHSCYIEDDCSYVQFIPGDVHMIVVNNRICNFHGGFSNVTSVTMKNPTEKALRGFIETGGEGFSKLNTAILMLNTVHGTEGMNTLSSVMYYITYILEFIRLLPPDCTAIISSLEHCEKMCVKMYGNKLLNDLRENPKTIEIREPRKIQFCTHSFAECKIEDKYQFADLSYILKKILT